MSMPIANGCFRYRLLSKNTSELQSATVAKSSWLAALSVQVDLMIPADLHLLLSP